ncbi:Endoribonuclease L-PSP/chorismate mutase-like protein [Aspergillus stella-maris]|uniref:Endoribonuclease L-PSP/chorismate mutase-like protein n=1 Tax=Aspergillus stella-maris TaxID=1810926 RepID=UPI003CCCB8CF
MLRISPRLLSVSRPLLTSSIRPRLSSRVQLPLQRATMSDLTNIFTPNACPPVGPYSQAIKANGQIFLSGQIPADKNGNLVEGDIKTKTQACCDNIAAILEAAGSSVSKIIRVNVFLDDMVNFAEMNAQYEKFFTHKPARSCIAAKQLPKGVPVEIECIALA